VEGVSLKIAVQKPVALSHGNLVAFQSKVIHTDKGVAGILEDAPGTDEHGQLFFRAGQGHIRYLPLNFEARRQMGVVVQGNSLGPKVCNLLDGAGQTGFRLPGEAVNQIGVNGFETEIPRPAHGLTNHFIGLDPIDRLLHTQVQVLNSEADAIEAQATKQPQTSLVHGAWINLDGIVATVIFTQGEVSGHVIDQFGDLGIT